jgi:DNA helicase-2/ATP-dependent DNA helicase PcrA
MASEAEYAGDFFGTTAAKIYELYQKKLERADAVDFGDLIMRTVSALQQHSELLEHYREKYKYIMVDEYQDTNHAQYMLIKLLAGKYLNICVVGDDDQSVYSWRGASIDNILDFEKDYPNVKLVKLEQNYRSTPKILSMANQVVKHNNARISKQLWTQNPDNGSVTVLKALNEKDEAAKIARLIYPDVYGNKCKFSDFAVFYRTNAQSRTFEDAFRVSCIPYVVVGTLRFYGRAEIKDVIAYLKLIHNPNDNVSFKRVINTPGRGIGKTSIETLEKFAQLKNMSIWQSVPFAREAGLVERSVKALNSFAQLIKDFSVLKDGGSVKLIAEKVITDSGYLKELNAENTPESKIKIGNMQELISAIDDFETRSSDKSLAGYLTQVALINDTDPPDESKGKVTLMTLHLAKGLEFNSVFICGLEERLFPIGESAFNDKELEEERRLMYMGMTRARKCLYLCWAIERKVYGKTIWNIPSRFIEEAGFKDESTGMEQDREQNFQNRLRQRVNRTIWSDDFGRGQNSRSFDKKSFKAKILHTNAESCGCMLFGDETTKDKRFDNPAEDLSPYKIGTVVSHPVFGRGKIIKKNGVGNDLKLVVLFETGQWKKLLARIANLTLI